MPVQGLWCLLLDVLETQGHLDLNLRSDCQPLDMLSLAWLVIQGCMVQQCCYGLPTILNQFQEQMYHQY